MLLPFSGLLRPVFDDLMNGTLGKALIAFHAGSDRLDHRFRLSRTGLVTSGSAKFISPKDHTKNSNHEIPLWIPKQIRVTITPAIMTPNNADSMAFQKFILMVAATKEPVHAPVTGKGIAIKKQTPQNPNF